MCQNPNVVDVPYTAKTAPGISIIHIIDFRTGGGGFYFEMRLSFMIRWLAMEAAMGERYSHLSLAERRVIGEMWEASLPVCQIVARLGRHRGTIHRELNRNFYHTSFRDRFGNDYRGYYCMTANAMAGRRRRHGRVELLSSPALLAHVVERLQAGWSPQQIYGRLRIEPQPVGRISHESIYRHVYSPEGYEAKLYALLAVARRHRRRQKGRKPRSPVVPAERWIEARPAEVADRSQFGHWEADLVILCAQARQGQCHLAAGTADTLSAVTGQ
jgi:IS30 family transposase